MKVQRIQTPYPTKCAPQIAANLLGVDLKDFSHAEEKLWKVLPQAQGGGFKWLITTYYFHGESDKERSKRLKIEKQKAQAEEKRKERELKRMQNDS